MSSCACLQVARLAEEEAEQAAAIAAAASPPKQVCLHAELSTVSAASLTCQCLGHTNVVT